MYNPNTAPADVLLVTSEAVARKEYIFWQRIFELLDVSVDFWDTTRFCGFSVDSRTGTRHKDSWQSRYTGKMIIYPHCNLQLLSGLDIAQHFHGPDFRENPLQELGSSLVAFMSGQQDENAMLKHLAIVNASVEIHENGYGGKHIFKPDPNKARPPYVSWEERFVKKLEKANPSQAPLLLMRNVDITSVGMFRYSYGSVDIRQVPILKSSKLLEIDGIGRKMDLDDANLSPKSTDIPLASNYGQVFLAVLYGLSIPAKLKLLRKEACRPSGVSFCLPNKAVMSREELVLITLAWEVADELFSCSGVSFRMREIYKDIKDNAGAYSDNGRMILRGLKLISKEINERKARFKNSKVTQASNEISDIIGKIQKVFTRVGVDNSKLEKMLSLESLQDRTCVRCCHQQYIKEGRWNLVDHN